MKLYNIDRIKQIFEEEAKKKVVEMKKHGLTCICGKCDLKEIALFSLKEIKEILEKQ